MPDDMLVEDRLLPCTSSETCTTCWCSFSSVLLHAGGGNSGGGGYTNTSLSSPIEAFSGRSSDSLVMGAPSRPICNSFLRLREQRT